MTQNPRDLLADKLCLAGLQTHGVDRRDAPVPLTGVERHGGLARLQPEAKLGGAHPLGVQRDLDAGHGGNIVAAGDGDEEAVDGDDVDKACVTNLA